MRFVAIFFIFLQLSHSGYLVKSKRIKKIAPQTSRDLSPSLEHVSEKFNLNMKNNIIHKFLNPSVREHLELGKSIPGRPGSDYPVLGEVPYTSFYCDDQEWPGFFADIETRCQAWHYCDIDGRQATFLCPNGTQFNQAVFICDWWFNVRCESSFHLYIINGELYHKKQKDLSTNNPNINKKIYKPIFI